MVVVEEDMILFCRGCRCMLFSLAAVVVFVIGRTMLIPFFLIN